MTVGAIFLFILTLHLPEAQNRAPRGVFRRGEWLVRSCPLSPFRMPSTGETSRAELHARGQFGRIKG
jgi:hypothetical protein